MTPEELIYVLSSLGGGVVIGITTIILRLHIRTARICFGVIEFTRSASSNIIRHNRPIVEDSIESQTTRRNTTIEVV